MADWECSPGCSATVRLRKFNLPQELLTQFYSAIIESVLCTSIIVWFSSATKSDIRRLQQRVQRADETITQYIAALRALSAPCTFGQMESEMLRDQLIANASLSAVRDKLLLEEDLTLEKAITIACQVEAAVKNLSLLCHSTGNATNSVQAIMTAGSPLLGLDLIRLLNLDIVRGEVKHIDHKGETSPAPLEGTEPSISSVHTVSPGSASHLGCVKRFIHKVQVSSTVKPVRQKLRHLPLSIRKEVSTELNLLLTSGIIELIDASEWVSPLVVVRKRDGRIRLCVDLREPNKSVIMDCYPIPNMEDLFTELAGASHYSQIDLSSAYHQLPLHPDSRNLTAFITHEGLFRFTQVPFGLASAPLAFQKMMQTVLKELDGVKNYLDDIIVYGNSQEAHDKHLQAVRQRLDEVGLQINFDKSSFNKASIPFLGHVISKEGLRPSPDHLIAIAEAPRPTDMVALRSFLGLTSWFNKFLPNYATVVEPLRQMLRAKAQAPLQWSKETTESFDTLKRMLLQSPVLAIYDPSLPTFISTDASDYGLGAVLTQLHPDGVERVIAFASRSLSTSERKYSIVEKEALTCVWAAGMRVARWSARLLCYQYDVQYRPGTRNCVADCLSRIPLSYTDTTVSPEQDLISEIAEIQPFLTALSLVDFKAECEDCPELSQLRQTIQTGWPKLQKSVCSELRLYFPVRHELAVESPLIFRGNRLIVPIALRERLIHLAHEGHQRLVRTKQRLRELYWWPRMDDLVHTVLSACMTCQASDKSAKTFPAPMQPVEFPKGPFEHVAIDIVGPFEKGATDFLTMLKSYRATPHATTGETPFLLLRGRPMRTKLNVLLPDDSPDQFTQVRARGTQRQNKSKQYTDRKRGSKFLKVAIGDKVRVRKPFHVKKGEARFTDPLSVQQQTGPSTFILSDGKRWNSARLSLCPEREETSVQDEIPERGCTMENAALSLHRGTRLRRSPAWTQDYVME
ncbi:Retrovirus-related Pol polyprotein from transposon opus [Labeo rohita]|uniref:Gypsy retrotransposon integrase-like protein 1 n=1 Tax=Labeo rohita TaxID=84645 RepID=A0ABQ8KYX7_LABRO|nr:Retrovirus-related Pol polyprotein from transposon opus [Labeo rohita]